METIAVILSSALIATILSSVVTVYVSRLNYKNKYYEKIIEKRLEAHDELNKFVSELKVSISDPTSDDMGAYHQIFASGIDEFHRFTIIDCPSVSTLFWVADRTKAAYLNINKEFFRCNLLFKDMDEDLIRVGRTEYQEIGKLRDRLEESLLSELPTLHEVDKFLKEKTVETNFGVVDLKRSPSDVQP